MISSDQRDPNNDPSPSRQRDGKRHRRRSIATELAIGLVLLVVVVEGVLLALIYQRQVDELYRQLQSKADEYATNLSDILAVPIWDLDDEQIRRIGDGFIRNELVILLHISDTEGSELYRFANDAAADQSPITRHEPILHTGKPIGQVRFALSLDTYRKDLNWLRNIALMVLILSLVLIVIATQILLRVLMRKPLATFNQWMEGVATGNVDHRFDDIHHEELAGIARRFATMADQIRHRERSLQSEVAERKRAEEKIRESDARTRAILDAIPDILFQFDRDGRFIDMRGDPDNLATTPDECIGRVIDEVMPPGIAGLFRRQLDMTFDNRGVRVFEYDLPVPSGMHHYECRLVAVSDKLALGMVRNISDQVTAAAEKKRLVDQLQRAQKMEALGMLAGGVAHDLNNILSGLVSYPELILLDLPDGSPIEKPILTIKSAGERAANIVQDLLTLARRGVSVAEVVNLNDVIDGYLRSPEYEALRVNHPGFQLKQKLAGDLLNISGSPVHLSKTVMNLVSNAVEASPPDGSVSISTDNRYVDTPIRGYDDIQEGDYVVMTIADNGIGMSADDIDRIFEPFYTKKVMGRSGTGLGMAVVWGTVKDHQGYIDIRSLPQQGTTVTIHIPATRESSSPSQATSDVKALYGCGERILVVDDVAEQRDIASGLLTRIGYKVESVSSGLAAVDYLKSHPVDLVVLDMIMEPGIDGLETYRRILQLCPGQRAIITSGFSESDRVQEARKLGATAYVKKPYLLETIAKAVKDALRE